MKYIFTDDYDLKYEVDFDVYFIPAEGDGWNEPHYPAHTETEVHSLFQLDEHDEPCGVPLDISEKFLVAIDDELVEMATDYADAAIEEKYESDKDYERYN